MKNKLILPISLLAMLSLASACGNSPANANNANKPANAPVNTPMPVATTPMPPPVTNGNVSNSAARKPALSVSNSASKTDSAATLADDDAAPAANAKKKK